MKWKVFCLSISLLGLFQISFAQEKNEFEELLLLFVDEEYEKCLRKAEKYTLDKETRREPMPYLYIAMCMLEISKIEEADELYPRAFKDALSYTYRYVKKDRDMLYYDDHADFFARLRQEAMLRAENEMAEESYSRAKYFYRGLARIDEKDPSALFMQAYTELLSKAGRDAAVNFEQAMRLYNEYDSMYSLTEEQRELMRYGFLTYADYLIQEGRSDSAYATLEHGKRLFLDDETFMKGYQKLKQ